jgi:hypothetical protein
VKPPDQVNGDAGDTAIITSAPLHPNAFGDARRICGRHDRLTITIEFVPLPTGITLPNS